MDECKYEIRYSILGFVGRLSYYYERSDKLVFYNYFQNNKVQNIINFRG